MTREIADLGYPVDSDVLYVIDLLKTRYGAKRSNDSGHTETRPTWIYDLPKYGDAQVAVPMNKKCLTLYLRDLTRDGRRLSKLLPPEKIKKTYPSAGKPAGSVYRARYLAPTSTNHLLRVELNREDVVWVLDDYLTAIDPAVLTMANASESSFVPLTVLPNLSSHRVTSAAELQAQLDRKSETGVAGEIIALKYELERLHKCGCPKPKDYIKHIAPDDVGAGYDIASTWPGEERFIEVKSTTRAGSDFFITENECQVLTGLREKAWLYRVVVGSGGEGEVVAQLQDPMNAISAEHRSPVVWRVASEALDESSNP
jgi:hypothetical protein